MVYGILHKLVISLCPLLSSHRHKADGMKITYQFFNHFLYLCLGSFDAVFRTFQSYLVWIRIATGKTDNDTAILLRDLMKYLESH